MDIFNKDNFHLLYYFVILIIILISIYLSLYILKKITPSSPLISKKNQRLKIVENLALDQKRRIVLIKDNNYEYLLLLGEPNNLMIKTASISNCDIGDHDKLEA